MTKALVEFPRTTPELYRNECKRCWVARCYLRKLWDAQPSRDDVRFESLRRHDDRDLFFSESELAGWELRLRAYVAELRTTLPVRITRFTRFEREG